MSTDTAFKTRLQWAQEAWEGRANGSCTTSSSKGGRAWFDGEFQLDELEALCVILRHEAGTAAMGLDEYILAHDTMLPEERVAEDVLRGMKRFSYGTSALDGGSVEIQGEVRLSFLESIAARIRRMIREGRERGPLGGGSVVLPPALGLREVAERANQPQTATQGTTK